MVVANVIDNWPAQLPTIGTPRLSSNWMRPINCLMLPFELDIIYRSDGTRRTVQQQKWNSIIQGWTLEEVSGISCR